MTNFVREEIIDGEAFLMIIDGKEQDIDSHYFDKMEQRKLPVKIAAFLVLFLACATTLLFLFIGL